MIKNKTYFVDIDGTIIKYRPFSLILDGSAKVEPINDVVDFLNSEYEKGSHIVITTARPESMKVLTKRELKKIKLKYHALLMNIGRGERIVLNDVPVDYFDIKKPKASAINFKRNKGFKGGTF